MLRVHKLSGLLMAHNIMCRRLSEKLGFAKHGASGVRLPLWAGGRGAGCKGRSCEMHNMAWMIRAADEGCNSVAAHRALLPKTCGMGTSARAHRSTVIGANGRRL